MGVHGKVAVEGDGCASFDERSALASPAESERFQPRHDEPAETVVQLGVVDIGRTEIGPRSHVIGPAPLGHRIAGSMTSAGG